MGNQSVEECASKARVICTLLENVPLYDIIDILSNVLIQIGVNYMDIDCEITPENIIQLVVDDKKKNGESLQNALAHQGLNMMLWLRKNK